MSRESNTNNPHRYVKVPTKESCDMPPSGSLIAPNGAHIDTISKAAGLPVVSDHSKYDVFVWNSPLSNAPTLEYPSRMRSFRPVSDQTYEEQITAKQIVAEYGPVIPFSKGMYRDGLLAEIEDYERSTVEYDVPPHQARGFHDRGVYVFATDRGEQIKFFVCTKGNGMSGYWNGRRQHEMLTALDANDRAYPMNPDAFHARDRRGQLTGSKKGDEVVWVGCASDSVTKREVEGFRHYEECGIYHPICLPVKEFQALPRATGQLIPTEQFSEPFDESAKLVYLAKAWTLETRIWGNHFSHPNMTAAHLLSAKNGENFVYQDILNDMQTSAPARKAKLDQESAWILNILKNTNKEDWSKIFGFAGDILSKIDDPNMLNRQETIIPIIMSTNMTENVAKAGANRIWGKPVAWHLENIGRLGEVSGGERIYDNGKGCPGAMEIHSLFAYMFDAYNAVAIEWATAGMDFMPFERFFQNIKSRILQLNNTHWIGCCNNTEQFVSLCQSNYPDYKVNFRSEDTYPLVAIQGTTDASCVNEADNHKWKDWNMLENNMRQFIAGIKIAYTIKQQPNGMEISYT